MISYKLHYACFGCRKVFKRRLWLDIKKGNAQDEARCPQCRKLMANMGLDFAAPPKNDVKKWEHLKNLYQVGITFHSCGCTGPGYIPRDKEQMLQHFEEIKAGYQRHLDFFRERVEPQTRSEKDRDRQLHWDFISKLPMDIRGKRDDISNEEAKNYWIEKIKEVEGKLSLIRNQA